MNRKDFLLEEWTDLIEELADNHGLTLKDFQTVLTKTWAFLNPPPKKRRK